MIYGNVAEWRKVPGLSGHPVWETAFCWLESSGRTADEGIHSLGNDGFFARVMSYATKARGEARYEMHHRTIDLQFSVDGAEAIELAPLNTLKTLGDYSEAKDVEHFVTPVRGSAVVDNLPGWFTVLYPGEPHMPQLNVSGFDRVRKVVVKIPVRLVVTG